MVSGTRCPYVSVCGCEVVSGAAAPKGTMSCRTQGDFVHSSVCVCRFEHRGWDLSLEAGIWTLRLGFEPRGWGLSLEARIWASRLEFRPQGWYLSLKAGIWALKLGFGPRGGDLGEGEGGEISRVKAFIFTPWLCFLLIAFVPPLAFFALLKTHSSPSLLALLFYMFLHDSLSASPFWCQIHFFFFIRTSFFLKASCSYFWG